jgi:hypothetical protein
MIIFNYYSNFTILMNKILAVSVLLGVTVMMMGSILPAMAFETNDKCKPGDETCGPIPVAGNPACKKIIEQIREGNIPEKIGKQILEKVCGKK